MNLSQLLTRDYWFKSILSRSLLAMAMWMLLSSSAAAQQALSGYDKLWSRAELFTGSENSPVQNVTLSGRLQFDEAILNSSTGNHDEFNLRRFRFGVKVEFLDNFLFQVEAELDPQDGNPVYRRLTDAQLVWSPSSEFELAVGKHGAAFTMDGQTSSKELLTIDRSNLSNNIWFTEEYIPGISISGEKNQLIYSLGYFSSGEKGREFGEFDENKFWLATIGHDFADSLGVEKALLRFNYVDNEPGTANSFAKPLQRVSSINLDLDLGDWGIRSDLSAAKGFASQSDMQGVMLMPYVNISENLQLVGRYTYLESDKDNGVRFSRYESEISTGRGDKYNEVYAGVNYYFYGHKLKLQSGLQYADMEDAAADGGAYTGWSWTTGLRLSW